MKNLITLLVIFVSFGWVNADITIDGKGGSWDLLAKGSLAIPTGDKLTFENVTVSKLSAGRLVVHHSTSQLVLENSILSLDGNYSFTQGSLVIKGDCIITGTTGTLFTFNGHNILIDHGATLKVKNVTFQAASTSRARQLIKFGNETSQFLLKDATFKVNNAPNGLLRSGGLMMIGGNLVIEGSSIIDNSSTASMHALQLGNAGYSSSDCKLIVRPNSKLTVKNAGIIFKNVGLGSLDLSGGRGMLDVDSSTNANFLIETPVNLSNSTFNFDFSTLKGLEKNVLYGLDNNPTDSEHKADVCSISWSSDGEYLAVGGDQSVLKATHNVYMFDGYSLKSLPPIGSAFNHGSTVWSVEFSPDGQYIAVGGEKGTGAYTHRVYGFNGSTLTNLVNCYVDHGTVINSVSWNPDGRYLAVGGGDGVGAYEVRVYKFDGSVTTTLPGCNKDYGAVVNSISWSPDGRYLAVGGVRAGGVTHRVYSFDGSSLTEVASEDHGGTIRSVSWNPNGKYFAIGGDRYAVGDGVYLTHRVYRFNGSSLIEVASEDHGEVVRSVSWSPNGRYLSIGGARTATFTSTHRIYRFDGSSLTEVALDPGGASDHRNQVNSVSWYPDGRYFSIGGHESLGDNKTQRAYPLQFTSINPLAQFQNATLNLGGGAFRLNNIELRGS